ncbi:MAG: PTS sugar transporter subunit IIA [Gammaproteobacteria bacterium]
MSDKPVDRNETQIKQYLSEDRILLDLSTTSRKRLFENIAELSSGAQDGISADCVFKTITERERLGSTGLGKGIAVPHGRIENLTRPVISIIRLKQPIEYDTPDDKPVWLAVGLLVPAYANETHLNLLSTLARCFQDSDFIDAVKRCSSPDQVSQLFGEIQD